MEKYLKIGIFFTLRQKKIPREKLKKFQVFEIKKMVLNVENIRLKLSVKLGEKVANRDLG